METRTFGASGIEASVMGLGTWAIGGWMWGGADEGDSIAAIRASIDQGVTLIDTAPAYGLGRSEEVVGKAIVGRRDEVVLSTKCGLVWDTDKGTFHYPEEDKSLHRYLGPESVRAELEASLRRLGTDRIDIYVTHWQDATTPIAETMDVLTQLRDEGKIRAIAASNTSRQDVLDYVAAGRLDGIQERYNALDRSIEEELVPLAVEHGISIMSYSSLALGLLSGKLGPERTFEGDDLRIDDPRFTQDNRARVAAMLDELAPLREDLGLTTAQLVTGWTLAQPGITYALVGARTPRHAIENARAGERLLSADVVAAVDAVFDAHIPSLA